MTTKDNSSTEFPPKRSSCDSFFLADTMSNIYIQEPPTAGKVLLVTTVGDIEIELWSKECPKACKNFVQLCMEKYYNKTTFHRVVKNFIVQGGDPTGTGAGGWIDVASMKYSRISI